MRKSGLDLPSSVQCVTYLNHPLLTISKMASQVQFIFVKTKYDKCLHMWALSKIIKLSEETTLDTVFFWEHPQDKSFNFSASMSDSETDCDAGITLADMCQIGVSTIAFKCLPDPKVEALWVGERQVTNAFEMLIAGGKGLVNFKTSRSR